MISQEDKDIAHLSITLARDMGADAVRATFNKSLSDTIVYRGRELDEISHSEDRSLFMHIFVDGRYGTFSTNRFEREELVPFIAAAVDATRLLEPSPLRRLPSRELCCKCAATGNELKLVDPRYERLTIEDKLKLLHNIPLYCAIIPEQCTKSITEIEYDDSLEENYIADSQGLKALHRETAFSISCEINAVDYKGKHYSDFEWYAAPKLVDLKFNIVETYIRAKSQLEKKRNPRPKESGKYTMVVDNRVSSRLVAPLLSALSGSAIAQHSSFLKDDLGAKVFSEGLTIMDLPRSKGKSGARLFDTEGVATKDRAIIECGEVKTLFLSTYWAAKLDMEQTIEGPSVPTVLPYSCYPTQNQITLRTILRDCKKGIYITGFNGGNCNAVTGDFSYGVEGFAFNNGTLKKAIEPMVITGNMKQLWSSLLFCGNDSRPCARWQVPTLAFEGVEFRC